MFAVALGTVLIFGESAIATKVTVSAISAIDVSITRTLIGGLVALRINLPPRTSQKWLLLLSGFCGFIAFPLLFTFGVKLGPVHIAGLCRRCTPATQRLLRARNYLLGRRPVCLAVATDSAMGCRCRRFVEHRQLRLVRIVTPGNRRHYHLERALVTGGIAQVGLLQYIQPVSGVFFAWLILSEKLSLIFLFASLIIMVGVILAFRAK
ncbi:MAG: EamA family transporter [Gammaproteobacteria bacterium]|nr:EamA family transporter [Gammaproteobacteria bacterium]